MPDDLKIFTKISYKINIPRRLRIRQTAVSFLPPDGIISANG
jgi:hypothetical protein